LYIIYNFIIINFIIFFIKLKNYILYFSCHFNFYTFILIYCPIPYCGGRVLGTVYNIEKNYFLGIILWPCTTTVGTLNYFFNWKKKTALILQNRIIIPVKRIFVYKITLAPGAVSDLLLGYYCYYLFILFFQLFMVFCTYLHTRLPIF